MKSFLEEGNVQLEDVKEDFNLGTTIAVLLLLMLFVGASFYFIVTGYLSVS